jgi:hypothetical protein
MSSVRKLEQETHLSFHEEAWACSSSKFSCRRWGSWGKKHIWVFMKKLEQEAHLSFHEEVGARSTSEFYEEVWASNSSKFSCRRWGSWGKKHIWVFMRKLGLAAHLSSHEEVWAWTWDTAKFSCRRTWNFSLVFLGGGATKNSNDVVVLDVVADLKWKLLWELMVVDAV